MGKLLNSIGLVTGLGLAGAGVVDGYRDSVYTSGIISDTRVSRVLQLRREIGRIPIVNSPEAFSRLVYGNDPEAVHDREIIREYTDLMGNDSVVKDVGEYDSYDYHPDYDLFAVVIGGVIAYSWGRHLRVPKKMESVPIY